MAESPASGDPRLAWQSRLRPALLPLAWCYSALQRLRRTAYRHRMLYASDCGRPVISVGSLLAGGSGKTPFAAHVARRLASLRVAVLTRGYGGGDADFGQVHSDSEAHRCGDEPLLLARRTGADVWVARNRAALARKLAPDYDGFILDDGFQHLRLQRTLNVCLVPDLPFDAVLPAGLWRESPCALADADFVVCTPAVPDWLPRYYEGPTGVVAFEPGPWETAGSTGAAPQGRALAFCGIARPERFWRSLSEFQRVGVVAFPDHHPYRAEELGELERQARKLGADALLTTAKDAVRLPARFLAKAQLPVYWRDVGIGWRSGEEDFARCLAGALGGAGIEP